MLELDFENGLDPSVRAVLTSKLLTDFEFFTRFFFKQVYGRRFVMAPHHHLIAEKMKAVARGDVRRLIINIPPRYGKCVDPETRVLCERGLVRAADIVPGDMLYSFKDGKLVRRLCNGTEPAFKPSVRVILRSGRSIVCSDDHPLLSTFGYKSAGLLVPGDRLVVLRSPGLTRNADSPFEDFEYEAVEEVYTVGEKALVHLSVVDTHNFIANGIVSHNTELAVKMFIAWCMANNPRAKFMHLSYADSLVKDNSDAIRDIIKCPAFRYLFPECAMSQKTDSKEKWYTEMGGGLYAVSTGSPITGFGAGDFGERNYSGTGSDADGFGGAIIIDDPLKPAEKDSDLKRERINARYNNTIASRVNNPGVTPVVLIMQRLHDHDMAGFLMSGGSGEVWETLSMPAITAEGEPLWPGKHSLEQLENIKKADPETFAAQYMQSPMVASGNIFKREWFKFWNSATIPAFFDRKFQSWDFTFDDTANSDYVCGTLWGKKGADFYLLERVWRRMTFTECVTAMVMMTRNHPDAIAKYVEKKANGAAVINVLSSKISGIVPVTPTESKVARAHAVTPLFEAGNVYVPEDAPWTADYIDELTKFPNAAHDDQVDSTTQGLSHEMEQVSIWDLM